MSRAAIFVLAGVNGAGKSSIGGAHLHGAGISFFNPDLVAREIMNFSPDLTQADANGLAWNEGYQQLHDAIRERQDFAFETTLGGATMTSELLRASAEGVDVNIWYVGLATPELHIARVEARVAGGGHAILEADIRRRFDSSRKNLLRLIPAVNELMVYDNSVDADPAIGVVPEPSLVLHCKAGKVLFPSSSDLPDTPEWAQPLVEFALEILHGF